MFNVCSQMINLGRKTYTPRVAARSVPMFVVTRKQKDLTGSREEEQIGFLQLSLRFLFKHCKPYTDRLLVVFVFKKSHF